MGKITMALVGEYTRVYIADTTDMVDEARKIHDTFPVATAALGRSITAASIMGKMLKGENEKLTFQIKAKGLIDSIVAVAWSNGNVKAFISDPHVDFEDHENNKLNVGGAIGTDGEIIIIKDLGLKDPYIGRSHLVSGEIAEDLAQYYLESEQQPSIISLGVLVSPDLSVIAAGGFFAQPMPNIPEDEIILLERAVKDMPAISSVIKEYTDHEEMLKILFPDMALRIMETYDVALKCDCSKEKLEKALITLGSDDIKEIIDTDGKAQLHCHFCNTYYDFSGEELINIYKLTKK
ncbi:MAG: Hsp33 family molecular chaperone HslO [Clostridiales bacterium]|nr:Hsp33 family molecular chaperone HslO [Clostridiales bacterium]